MGFFDMLGGAIASGAKGMMNKVITDYYQSIRRASSSDLEDMYKIMDNGIKKKILLVRLAEIDSYRAVQIASMDNIQKNQFLKFTEISETREGAMILIKSLEK